MSVYIKGMEMPTSCDKCIYSAWSNFYQIYVCNAVRKNEPVLFDGKQTKSTAVSSARADNCPLVPVPDHGRLIDADALTAKFKEMGLGEHSLIERLFADGVYVMLDRALTVIPADGKDTNVPAREEGEG